MANWSDLKAAVAEVIKNNGNNDITGQILQDTLNSIISNVGENATYAGIATPTTNPGAPDGNVFYFATQAGTYTNFGSVELNEGLNILRWNGTSWEVTNVMTIVQGIGDGENVVMSQKAVTDAILNKIDLSEIDLDSVTIYNIAIAQVPCRYIVTAKYLSKKFNVGMLECFSDNMGHMVTQKLTTHYTLVDSELGTVHLDDKIFTYFRSYHISGGTSDIPVGTWGEWKQVYSSDNQNDIDALKISVNNLNANTGLDEYKTFSDQKAYSAGDTVMYNGLLYTFTIDHAAGAWSGSDIEETDVVKAHIVQELGDSETVVMSQKATTDKLTEIENRLLPNGETAIITKGNLLNGISYTNRKYLDKLDGSEVPFERYSYTDYISLEGIEKLICSMVPNHGGCFYDSDKSFIEGFGIDDVYSSLKNYIVVVPENAAFIRFNVNIKTRDEGTAYLIDYDNRDIIVQYPWLISPIRYEAFQVGLGIGWLSDDGTIKLSPPNGKFYKFDLPNGSIAVIVSNSTNISTKLGWSAFWFVDENGEFIESVSIDITRPIYENYRKSIPNNAKQIWISSGEPKVIIINDGNIINDISGKIENRSSLNHFFGKKIVWLGTSIPYGQTSESGVSNPMPTPYPIIVGSNLKANVVNVARPGMAIETESNGDRKEFGSLSLSISELEEKGHPTTPYQSYENAMLGQDADLYVFDCEPNNSNGDTSIIDNFDFYNWKYKDGTTFESHRDSYIGAFLFLLDKLWSEKPDAKVVMVSEFGYCTQEKWGETYGIREASLAIAKKLNIHVINLWDKLYYNKQNLSIYMNSDNIHPKAAAHIRMGAMLTNELLLID